MMQDDQASRVTEVSYALDGEAHQIRWKRGGKEFGMESQDLKRLIQAVLVAVTTGADLAEAA